jgi:hypothetical protein
LGWTLENETDLYSEIRNRHIQKDNYSYTAQKGNYLNVFIPSMEKYFSVKASSWPHIFPKTKKKTLIKVRSSYPDIFNFNKVSSVIF